ncbi:MAG TPA: tetratricopeptide repeat protein, partial [Steroidobacteraceae bacterium]|nr:tetratricopeptide repeat protein [Steroidobacteraceae bacterium]
MNSIDPARRRDLEAAMRHHRAGRLREAVAAYENLLRVTPDDADVMQLLGVALGQLGNHEAAVRFLERSPQLKPDRPTVLLKRSDLLRRMAGLTL